MDDSQDTTQSPCIAYLGPPASFSHQAALEAFSGIEPSMFLPLPSFEAILSAVQQSSGENVPDESSKSPCLDFALLPVENSTNGAVVPVLDLLVRCGRQSTPCVYPDIEIVAEHYLKVHHCLFVHESVAKDHKEFQNPETTPLEKSHYDSLAIKTLYTHPQVWGQCTKFLSTYFPQGGEVERINMSSTSAAATFVAQNSTITTGAAPPESQKKQQDLTPQQSKPGNKAAICTALAGQQHKLTCLASNIEDNPGTNTTRFFIIRNRHRKRQNLHHFATFNVNVNTNVNIKADSITTTESTESSSSLSSSIDKISYKSLVTFTISHTTPGSLATALSIFQKHRVNLTAITTRPSQEQPWHYVFFIECEKERDIDINVDIDVNVDTGGSNHNKNTITNRKNSTMTINNDKNDNNTNFTTTRKEQDDKKVQAMFNELNQVTERTSLLGTWINRLRH